MKAVLGQIRKAAAQAETWLKDRARRADAKRVRRWFDEEIIGATLRGDDIASKALAIARDELLKRHRAQLVGVVR